MIFLEALSNKFGVICTSSLLLLTQPLGLMMFPIGIIDLQKPQYQAQETPFEWLVRVVQVTPKTIETVTIALGCL